MLGYALIHRHPRQPTIADVLGVCGSIIYRWQFKVPSLLTHTPEKLISTRWLTIGSQMEFERCCKIQKVSRVWDCERVIIIMPRYQHGYSWPSLAIPPHSPLLPVGLQEYIPYRHWATVCRFELVVLPLLVHVKGSTGVHQLWARPYISSSVPHVWFV